MNSDPATPVTMAELERSDPALAARVRRARRRQDTENIRSLAQQAQQQAQQRAQQRAQEQLAAARQPHAEKIESTEEPEPIWR